MNWVLKKVLTSFLIFGINKLYCSYAWIFCAQKQEKVFKSIESNLYFGGVRALGNLIPKSYKEGEMIMKTSKRLLSFFLAVVMVITTCSVGFAAFAADDPEDQVFTYVDDEGRAVELTYDGLNDLVNTYAPLLIEALRGTLEGIGVNVDAILASENPIGELLGQLAPTLLGLLGTSATPESVLGSKYDAFSEKKYAYLDDPDAAMDFWNLYTICKDNAGAGGELGKFCSETLPKLDALLNAYDNTYAQITEQTSELLSNLLGNTSFSNATGEYALYISGTDELYQQAYAPMKAFGFPAIPASHENVGDIVLVDGTTTLQQLSDKIDANGYVYDQYDSDPSNDIDLNPFISYVSYYAQRNSIISADEKLSFIDAIYYFYNHRITTDKHSIANALISSSGVDCSFTFTQKTAVNLLHCPEFSVTYANGTYWHDSAYDQETGFSYDIFAQYAVPLLGYRDSTIATTARYYMQGFYENLSLLEDFFRDGPFPNNLDDSVNEWYAFSIEQMLVDNGDFENIQQVQAVRQDYILDEDELTEMKAIAERTGLANVDGFVNELINTTGNEVLKYYAQNNKDAIGNNVYITTNTVSELLSWEPGDEINETDFRYLNNLKNRIDNYFGYAMMQVYELGDSNNYLEYAGQVMDIIAVSGSITERYNYEDYAIPASIAVDLVNTLLNNLINQYLDPDAPGLVPGTIDNNINDILQNLLTTDVPFADILQDVYKRLAENPVKTLFELIPALVVLIDEVVIPLAFNEVGDAGYGPLNLLLPLLLGDLTQSSGSATGVGQLGWDLNTVVPTLLHWLLGDNDYTYTYYNRTDNGDGTFTYGATETGAYGTKYDDEGELTGRVPVILNIYAADAAIANAAVSDLGIAGEGEDPQTAQAVGELVTELVTFATEVVDDYVAEHGDDVKSYNESGTPSNRGLNNLLVALPSIINDLGQKFLEKYEVESDWSFGEFDEDSDGCRYNVSVQQFKDLVGTDDASEVLSTFVDLFINNWFNAITDILNDVVSDTENKITSEIPIVTSLLNTLDLFGETSVLTNILDGLFLIGKDDGYDKDALSFKFETQENGYVGLDTLNAYFLLINLNKIIDVITNIVEANQTTPEEPGETPEEPSTGGGFDIMSILTPALNSIADNVPAIENNSENIEGAAGLIDALDSLLSTLLSNSYLNGYQLDQVDGALSGIVTVLTNAFGENEADQAWYIISKILTTLNAGSANADGSANANANGPVDADEVYTTENLSDIVTQTYALVESLIEDNLVIAGDEHKLINSAIDGIFSPSAVVTHSNDAIDDGVADYFSWRDVALSNYATDLGYSFRDGNKEAFYENLINSLGVIPSILGVLLVDAGLYNDVLAPLFGIICDTMGVEYTASLDSDATGTEATLAVIEIVSNVLGELLNAPISSILELVRAIVQIAPDNVIGTYLNNAVNIIYNELDGLKNILANLSPTLPAVIDNLLINPLKATISEYIPSSNVLLTLIGKIAGTDLSSLSLILSELTPHTTSNEKLLLALYTVLVDLLTDESVFGQLVGNQYPWLTELITKYDSASLLNLIKDLVNSIQSPKELKWIYDNYKKESNNFEYPVGVTAQEAEDAVDSLDDLVANLFPLLQEFGVVDQNNLADLLNGFIFTNANITALAKAVYGGIESASQNDADGIFVFSPSQFADYLMDSSYGTTFSSAASTLRRCSTWSQVGTVNWGFTDGSASAQTGFVKALAALTRPVNDVLAAFLAEGNVNLASVAAQLLKDFDVNTTVTNGDFNVQIILSNSTLTINFTNNANPGSKTSSVVVDLVPVIEQLSMLTIAGGNGYESAVIPLLNAFNVECKSYDQYLKDYRNAKDNLIINILNPIVDFLNDVTAAPFDTLTAALPKLAEFLDNNGLGKVVNNLLSPITALIDVLNENGINVDSLIEQITGKSLKDLLEGLIGMDLGNVKLELTNLDESLNIQDILIPLVNGLLKDNGINIKLDNIDWGKLASLSNQGQVLVTVLRYIENVLIKNAAAINSLLSGIDAIKSNKTILNILDSIFGQIATAKRDDIVLAVFYLLLCEPTNVFFDYSSFEYKSYDFSYPTTVDIDFLTILGPMLDGLIGGLIEGGLSGLVTQNVYKDSIISSIATGLYGAIEGVKINDSMNLTELLAMTDIDFSTGAVADLLENKDYGQTYSSAARTIRNAGSWSRVNANSLSWGVTDRDSFVHALCAVLRPLYGVLDVLLNDGSLGLFNLIYLPGSDGYTSTIVPLLEAFGCYNIKTQYQYRQDMSKEYDYILIDILNPLLDKVEDLLNAPIQTLADMLPNLALFFANDGLLQIIENLLTPINALLDALQPIADVNDILATAGLDIEGELRKLGLVGSNYNFDIYDLAASLRPLIGKDNIVSLLNKVLGMIEVNGAPLGIELMPIDWYQLASHGEVIVDEASQASTHGKRIYVDADPNEVLIAVLRYLVETINYKDNYNIISNLIGGLIGGADDSISDVIDTVLGLLTGETDQVISDLCGLLQTLA